MGVRVKENGEEWGVHGNGRGRSYCMDWRIYYRMGGVREAYFFFFNDTATTEIYTLSLHDALPI